MSNAPVLGPARAAGDTEINNIGKSDGNEYPASEISPIGVSSFNFGPEIGVPLTDQSFDEDTPFSIALPNDAFIDAEGDTLTYQAFVASSAGGHVYDPQLPSWLTFDTATGTLTGNPPENYTGSLDIRITASDGNGGDIAEQVFTLTINPLNDEPEVGTVLADQSFDEDTAVSFTLPADSFTDVDGDPLTLSATLADGSALPSWLNFNATTGTFSGNPPLNFNGTLSIKVNASDGTADPVAQTFTLTISPENDDPVVSTVLADQSFDEDTAVSFTLPADSFTDVDGDPLTLSATLADGSALPSWLSFNAVTRAFSGNPPLNFNGTLSIKVSASDGTADPVTQSFDLVIEPENDKPVVGTVLPDQVIDENTPFSYTLPSDAFTDVDGDTLTLVATLRNVTQPLPDWLSFDPDTHTLSGTPPEGYSGSFYIKVTASDLDGESTKQVFRMTINAVNDAPEVGTALSNQSFDEDTAVSFTLPTDAFTDPDGDPLTLSATLADGSALPSWLSFNAATGTFSGTPPQNFNGTLSIKVSASDGTAGPVSQTFTLTIAPENDAPAIGTTLAGQSFDEDTAVSFTLPADAFTDPDGDPLTLSATLADGSALPSWLSFNAATGTFSGTPPQNFNGTLSIKVSASDGTADPVSQTFDLVIEPENDDPEVGTVLADQSFDEDTAVSFTLPADAFTDPDGDPLTYSAWQREQVGGGPFPLIVYSLLPSWLTFNSTTGAFSGTPPQDYNGSIVIAVRADDGNGGDYAEQLFTLTIDPVNDDPEVGTALADVVAAEGADISFTLPEDAFTDVDGDTLTLTATLADGSALPSWLVFDPFTGTFSGTPPAGSEGSLSVLVSASDGQPGSTAASQEFDLKVEEAEFVFNGFVPVGAETEVVASSNALSSTVGVLADGSYVVVWHEIVNIGDRFVRTSHHAQRFDSDGTPIGSAFTVGTFFGRDSRAADIVSLEDGGYIINFGTTAQRYDNNGEAVGDSFSISSLSRLIELDAGGFLLPHSTPAGHFVHLYDSNLNLLNSIQVSTTVGPNYYTGHATALAGGGYITTWLVGQLGDLDVYARLLDSDGNPVGSDFLVNTTIEGNQSGGDVTALADGGFVVTWWGIGDSGGTDLFAQRFDSNGYPIGAEFQVNTTSEGFEYFRGLNELDDGGFVITWYSSDGQGTPFGYFAQHYDSNGSPIGGEIELTEAEALQYEPDTAFLNDGDLIRVYRSETGVYTQRYTADGTLAGSDITGSDEADMIFGTEADDTIDAAGDDDTLTGGGGSDILSGGTGSDTFVFNFGDTGHDTVTDFTAGAGTDDIMEFDSALFATYDALLAAVSDDGTNTTITIDAETTITLEGITVADLHQDDFNFV